jgi:ribosomal protein L35
LEIRVYDGGLEVAGNRHILAHKQKAERANLRPQGTAL